jgi:hypothetical protein
MTREEEMLAHAVGVAQLGCNLNVALLKALVIKGVFSRQQAKEFLDSALLVYEGLPAPGPFQARMNQAARTVLADAYAVIDSLPG